MQKNWDYLITETRKLCTISESPRLIIIGILLEIWITSANKTNIFLAYPYIANSFQKYWVIQNKIFGDKKQKQYPKTMHQNEFCIFCEYIEESSEIITNCIIPEDKLIEMKEFYENLNSPNQLSNISEMSAEYLESDKSLDDLNDLDNPEKSDENKDNNQQNNESHPQNIIVKDIYENCDEYSINNDDLNDFIPDEQNDDDYDNDQQQEENNNAMDDYNLNIPIHQHKIQLEYNPINQCCVMCSKCKIQ